MKSKEKIPRISQPINPDGSLYEEDFDLSKKFEERIESWENINPCFNWSGKEIALGIKGNIMCDVIRFITILKKILLSPNNISKGYCETSTIKWAIKKYAGEKFA